MIKSLTVTNHLGDSIKLELTRPESSGFIIKNIEGLGPAKANINTTTVATSDGALYNSARLSTRDLIINLIFCPLVKETIEDIRQKSYKYFPIKRRIKLLIETDNRVVETEGIVEANEPDIFSESEGCAITVTCPDPFLYSMEVNETVFSGIEAMFEFPFSTDISNDSLLEFSAIQSKTEETVYYEGDHEVGVTVIIHAIGTASNVTIYNTTTGERMKINTDKLPESSILEGDVITIETRIGHKSISLLRNGVKTNILNVLDKKSDWLTLSKGANIFVYTADNGRSNLQFSIHNKVVYDGV